MRIGSARWVCYLLACADGSLYTGITNRLDHRLAAHDAGSASKYTRARRPVRLAWLQACRDRSHAARLEAAIKGLPRTAKLALTCEPRALARLRRASRGRVGGDTSGRLAGAVTSSSRRA